MRRTSLLILFALVGCTGGEKVTNAPASGDTVQLPSIEWRVVDRAGLIKAYRNSGMDTRAGQQLEGFAGIDTHGTHVIYTLPPRTVDDQVTCTLGHEVMHIALGKYHRE